MKSDGLRSFSAPISLAGMRPVDIWKSTAAAPAPISDGAWLVPCAPMPWHVAQLWMNSDLPFAMSVDAWLVAADDAAAGQRAIERAGHDKAAGDRRIASGGAPSPGDDRAHSVSPD